MLKLLVKNLSLGGKGEKWSRADPISVCCCITENKGGSPSKTKFSPEIHWDITGRRRQQSFRKVLQQCKTIQSFTVQENIIYIVKQCNYFRKKKYWILPGINNWVFYSVSTASQIFSVLLCIALSAIFCMIFKLLPSKLFSISHAYYLESSSSYT